MAPFGHCHDQFPFEEARYLELSTRLGTPNANHQPPFLPQPHRKSKPSKPSALWQIQNFTKEGGFINIKKKKLQKS